MDNSPVVNTKAKSQATATGRAPRFLLALPEDLRHALEKSALAVGRPLTTEINRRLRESLKSRVDVVLRDRQGVYTHVLELRTGEPELDGIEPADLEAELLEHFRRLPMEKKIALLALMK